MKHILFILLTIVISNIAFSQTHELITDRPDQTESAQVVPLNSLQIESGIANEVGIFGMNTFTPNSTLLRFGLFENFELRLGAEYSILTSDMTAQKIRGLNPLYVGMKFQITDEDGLYPGIAFLGGLNLPIFASKDFKTNKLAPDFRFSISHTLADWLSLGYNLGLEWNGDDNQMQGIYSIVLGLGVNDWLGLYIESFGYVWDPSGAQHMLDAGFTFLVKDNFQLDVSSGFGINSTAAELFLAGGFSWRVPK